MIKLRKRTLQNLLLFYSYFSHFFNEIRLANSFNFIIIGNNNNCYSVYNQKQNGII